MPWMKFVPGLGPVEETENEVYLRGRKCNESFTENPAQDKPKIARFVIREYSSAHKCGNKQ